MDAVRALAETQRIGIDPAVAEAAGGSLANAVKVNVFLTDLSHFAKVNDIMATYCAQPYPARAAIGVAQLPRGARVEIECVLYLG